MVLWLNATGTEAQEGITSHSTFGRCFDLKEIFFVESVSLHLRRHLERTGSLHVELLPERHSTQCCRPKMREVTYVYFFMLWMQMQVPLYRANPIRFVGFMRRRRK
jgi:hypothetical protein